MKCKHFAEYEGICTNGDCFYRADLCPVEEHQETCRHFQAVKKKVPPEQKQISDTELLQECEKFNISLDSLINDFELLVKSCFRWQVCEHSLDELKETPYYRYFLERALTLKILKEYKKEHNTNDDSKSEVKQKIEMIKQGKLPPIPSVDNQSTKGLVTRNKKEHKK